MSPEITRYIEQIRRAVFVGKPGESVRLALELYDYLLTHDDANAVSWQEVFQVVTQAIERRDYLLMADVITYEIPEVCKKG